ncbi:MAG: hypothetical protein D6788_05635, partial [Planctomycetota bacterium]
MTASVSMTAPAEVYRARRAKLAASLSRPLVLFAGEPRARQYATNTYPFRAASNYLYFGGPPVPGAALLIEPGSDGDDGCLLIRRRIDFEEIVWIGDVPSDSALAEASGMAQRNFLTPDRLDERVKGRRAAYLAPPCPPTMEWVRRLELEPASPDDIQPIIDQRLIKDDHELSAMRFAAEVAV